MAKKKSWPTVPRWLDFIYDITIIAMLVHGEMMITAILYAVHLAVLSYIAIEIEEVRLRTE